MLNYKDGDLALIYPQVVQILLCFSRDTHLLSHFKDTSANPARAYTRNAMGRTVCVCLSVCLPAMADGA